MPIKAQSQGKTFTFSDGTSPEVMGAAIDDFFSKQSTPQIQAGTTGAIPGVETLSPRAQQELSPQKQQELLSARSAQQQVAGRPDAQPLASRQAASLDQLRKTAPVSATFARDIEEIGSAPELREFNFESLRRGVAAGLIGNEAELANAIKDLTPGAEIQQDPEGNPVVKMPSGGTFAINKPGLSGQDFVQFATRLLSFIPAGRVIGSSAGQLAKGAAASAATETGLQAGESVVGGEFTPSEVLTAGAVAPLGQAVGEAIISPAARAVGGEIAPEAQQLIRSGQESGVDVLTSDILPPSTNISKTVQQLSEKLGPLGTGGIRAAQQQARIDVVEELAKDLSIESESILSSAVGSLNKGVAKNLEAGARQKGEGVFRLSPLGDVPVKSVNSKIDRQIAKEQSLKGVANQQVISKLTDYRNSIQNSSFGELDRVRSRISADIRDARAGDSLPTSIEAPLQAIKSELDNALKSFASTRDREALSMWLKGNRKFFDTFGKARRSVLKQAIKEGEMKPETLGRIIKQGQTSDLKRLNSLLDESGIISVQSAIIRDALEDSGFFGAGANPDRFVTALQKGPRQRAINIFFTGEAKKQLKGIERLLDNTRRAQQAAAAPATGQQVVGSGILVGGGAGLVTNPITTIFSAASMFALTRGYESKAFRNAMLKLANTKKGSEAERRIIEKVLPPIISTIQATRTEEEN